MHCRFYAGCRFQSLMLRLTVTITNFFLQSSVRVALMEEKQMNSNWRLCNATCKSEWRKNKQLSGTNKSRGDMGIGRSFKMANVIVETSKASIRLFFTCVAFWRCGFVLNINEAGREETNSNFSPTKASLLSHTIKSTGFWSDRARETLKLRHIKRGVK